jgi:hypothetical protein
LIAIDNIFLMKEGIKRFLDRLKREENYKHIDNFDKMYNLRELLNKLEYDEAYIQKFGTIKLKHDGENWTYE